MGETVIPRVTIRMLRSEYASQHGGRLYAGDVLNVTYPEALGWVGLGIAEAVGGASADQIRQQLDRMRAMDAEIRAQQAQQESERRARQQMLDRIRAEQGQRWEPAWWSHRMIEAATLKSQVRQVVIRDSAWPTLRYGQGMVRGYLWSKYGAPRPWSLRSLDVLGRRCLKGATGA